MGWTSKANWKGKKLTGYFQPRVFYTKPDAIRKDSIIRYIGQRVINSNKNFLCALTGQTGSGKSWAGIKLCELHSKMHNIPFNPKIHSISSLRQLLELINNKEIMETIRIGTPILLDEPQVEANARSWQSEANQILSTLISTFRNQRLVVFFACPVLEFIDKQSRILFHGEFRIIGFDKSTKITTIKPRFLEYSGTIEDFYRKRLIVHYAVEGKPKMSTTKVNLWHVDKASDEALKIYEEQKKQFTDELNAKLLARLNESEEKENKKEDKAKILFDIEAIYKEKGEDLLYLAEKYPNLSVFALEKYLHFIKKSHKMRDTRAAV